MKSTHSEVELKLLVEQKRTIADGVVSLVLTPTDGELLPAWAPGAHIDLVLSNELNRQYSLCGDPADRQHWQVGVLREEAGRAGSRYVHDTLNEGDHITVRGPRNHFVLQPSSRYLFIAGGIGITPIIPMISQAEAAGSQWRLVYGGRSRNSMAFWSALADKYPDRVDIVPQDERGLLDLPSLLGQPVPDTLIYCCGPAPLLNAVEANIVAWPPGTLHFERFAPKEQTEPESAESFEVKLAQSGGTIVVSPRQTVLAALREAGVDIVSSCEEGTCGTCETAVLGGIPDHRDSLLTPEEQAENNTFFPCVSRSKTPTLILDI